MSPHSLSLPEFLPVAQADTDGGLTHLRQCRVDQHISPAPHSRSVWVQPFTASPLLPGSAPTGFFYPVYQRCALTDLPASASHPRSLTVINTSAYHPAIMEVSQLGSPAPNPVFGQQFHTLCPLPSKTIWWSFSHTAPITGNLCTFKALTYFLLYVLIYFFMYFSSTHVLDPFYSFMSLNVPWPP